MGQMATELGNAHPDSDAFPGLNAGSKPNGQSNRGPYRNVADVFQRGSSSSDGRPNDCPDADDDPNSNIDLATKSGCHAMNLLFQTNHCRPPTQAQMAARRGRICDMMTTIADLFRVKGLLTGHHMASPIPLLQLVAACVH